MKNVLIALSCVLVMGCASDNLGMVNADDDNVIDNGNGTTVNLSDYFNIDFNFKVGYYKTKNLYSEDNFLDISTSLIYNIQK